MTKSSKSWWARFLFQDRGILPTKRLIRMFLVFSIVLVVIGFWGVSWTLVIIINIFFLILSLFDLRWSPQRSQLSFQRQMEEEFERGVSYRIAIEMRSSSPFPFSYQIVDDLPQSFIRPFPLSGSVQKGEAAIQVQYETTGMERGKYVIQRLYIRYASLFGLWEKQLTVELPQTVKVIPDLTETKQYLENAQQFLQYEGAAIRRQRTGVGDFSKIRSYVVGDDPRKINWRQTAKLQEMMTNEYEPEHGKFITILLDCGRMMGAELTKGNRLERSLEAALTVAVAALQKGDYVSVLAFSKHIKAYIPPAKGMRHLQTILQSIYDLKVDPGESNYGAVFQYLQSVQKKRSLLLLFSDVRTFLHEESALLYLKRLRQRHLFFMIGVEDRSLILTAKKASTTIQSAMNKSIAQQQILLKKREKGKWEKQGLQMIEAREEKLAVAAVSQYIEIMNQNLL